MIKLVETATQVLLKPENGQDIKSLYDLSEELKVRPPEYWRAASYLAYQMSDGQRGWDGYLKPLKVLKDGGPGVALRGHISNVLAAAALLGVKIDTSGQLDRPFKGLTLDDVPPDILNADFDLDDYQRRCIASWLANANGVHKMATSTGKTACFCAAAAMIKRRFPNARFLYFTPSERLCKQVTAEAKKFLPGWDIVQYGGGKSTILSRDQKTKELVYHKDLGSDMVVATIAILGKNFKRLFKEGFFKTFMVLCADESHTIVGPTAEKIALSVPAFFRFGASDTMLIDDEIKKLNMHGLLGPHLETVEVAPLMAVGRIARPTIYVVDVEGWKNKFADYDHAPVPLTPAWVMWDNTWKKGVYQGPVYQAATPDKDTGLLLPGEEDGYARDRQGNPIRLENLHHILLDGKNYEMQSRWCLLERTYDKAIIQFKDRNALIAQWAKHFSEQKRHTLVIATRTLHVLILQSLIESVVKREKVRILFSHHSSAERDATFSWFKKTEGAVLITPLVKVGVSINEINAGIIADHLVSYEVATQMVGRFIRKKEGDNTCPIVMFMDRQHPRLRANSIKLFQRLEMVRGFSFRHPVAGPESLAQSELFEYLGDLV